MLILAPAPAQLLDIAGPAEVFAQAGRLLSRADGGSDRLGRYTPVYDTEIAIVPGAAPATMVAVIATGRTLEGLVADPAPLDTLVIGGGEGAPPPAPRNPSSVRPSARSPAARGASRPSAPAPSRSPPPACSKAGALTTHWRWC